MLKAAIIGAGGIAQSNHIPALIQLAGRCQIVGICDVDADLARTVAEKHSIPGAFEDHKEMLRQTKPDVVVVATPNRFHIGPTLDAIEAGCHVLCEKPLGMTGREARQMADAAQGAGKVLQVGLQLRFSGPMQFLLNYIKNGEMGPIYYARAQALRRRGVPSWGVFIDKEKQGGGPLIDIGVHLLDLTLAAMGHPKPVSASAQTWDRLGKNPDLYNGFGEYDRSKFTVEDFAVGFIRFENGAVVTLESSFMGNMEGNPTQVQWFGEKSGAVLKPFDKEHPLTLTTERRRQLFTMTPDNIPGGEPQHKAMGAFLDAVEGKAPCIVTAEHGLALNAIFDAMYASAANGREVPVTL